MQQIYDLIIVGGGAAGLFLGLNSPKNYKTIILERNDRPGIKVLLSGGERANLSNMYIDPLNDYFGQNKKALLGIFSKFNNYDTISFFNKENIEVIEEDRGRLILKSGDSKELLNILIQKNLENKTSIINNSRVIGIKKENDLFYINTENKIQYISKKVAISSGGASFWQVGTTGDSFGFATSFGIKVIPPYRGLCGLVTKKDLKEISGVSTILKIKLIDKSNKNKFIYEELGPLLFTHFGVSGPIIFNLCVALGEYLNSLNLANLNLENKDEIFSSYMKENLFLELEFDLEKTAKSIVKFFLLNNDNLKISLDLQDFRSWKEAKVTGGGVGLNELNKNLESKKVPGLYFIGEALDLTGKTGGFNLQLAWSTAFVVSESLV